MPSKRPIHNAVPTSMGCLFVVATPIGNLEDITLRALKTLAQVDLIAAEDTRHTRKLLTHHNISGRLASYHEHNETKRTEELVARLTQGEQIALVTNAGTPVVSDPGYRLVSAAIAKGVPVIPIPGVSAAITALSASGMDSDRFIFIGFPSRKKEKRRRQISDLSAAAGTIIFYQSPYRIVGFIEELIQVLGDRKSMLAREMTKLHEEFLHGRLSDIHSALLKRDSMKGECTLLVGPAGTAKKISGDDDRQTAALPREEIERAILQLLASQEAPLSDIARRIAKQFGLKRTEAYDLVLRHRDAGQA